MSINRRNRNPRVLFFFLIGDAFTFNVEVQSMVPTIVVIDEESKETETNEEVVVKKEVNRCSRCRKRVGLTGFRCWCGDLFCAEHRYSDCHDWSYDYKTAGPSTCFP